MIRSRTYRRVEDAITHDELLKDFVYVDGGLYNRRNVDRNGCPPLESHKMGWVDTRSRSILRVKLGTLQINLEYAIFFYHHGYTPSSIVFLDGNRMNCAITNLVDFEALTKTTPQPEIAVRAEAKKVEKKVKQKKQRSFLGRVWDSIFGSTKGGAQEKEVCPPIPVATSEHPKRTKRTPKAYATRGGGMSRRELLDEAVRLGILDILKFSTKDEVTIYDAFVYEYTKDVCRNLKYDPKKTYVCNGLEDFYKRFVTNGVRAQAKTRRGNGCYKLPIVSAMEC